MTSILELDPLINTGLNEVAELWYGVDGVARVLVHFNIDDYMNLYDENLIPTLSDVETTLNFFDCATYQTGATSFDLDVYSQIQAWDSGVGYDHIGLDTQDGFANWYSATTSSAWTTAGGDLSIFVGSQHFDLDNENMNLNISSDISYLWDQFTGDNHGILIKFSNSDEALNGVSKRVKKFYSNNTHDYKFPFLQLDWDSRIIEDRSNIIAGMEYEQTGSSPVQYIYLFTHQNGKMKNVYSVSSVAISGKSSKYYDVILTGDSRLDNPEAGVYRLALTVPSDEEYEDLWELETDPGRQRFVTKTFTASTVDLSWDLSSATIGSPVDYQFSIPSLQQTYVHGEKIYLPIFARKEYTSEYCLLKSLEYKISLIDGQDSFIMEDWTPASYTTDSNFILLNTVWYLSGYRYKIEFRYYNATTLKYSSFERNFNIVD